METYIVLKGGEIRAEADPLIWGKFFHEGRNIPFEEGGRLVARTHLSDGKVFVSTVFLGMDHAWGGGPPLLFETMIFGGGWSDYQERHHTINEAKAGHERAVKRAEESIASASRQ